MEASADGSRHRGIDRLEDDRRPAAAGGRALRRPRRGRATSATAPGTTSPTRELGEIVAGDRPRPDRPRHRSRASASRILVQHAPRVDLRRLRRSPPPAPSSCRSTRPTRPRSASGWLGDSERAARSSARTPSRSRRSPRSATAARLRTSIVIDPPTATPADAIALDELRERGRARDARRARRARRGASSPRTPSRSSTPPARPARRRAACSRTATTARSLDMVGEARRDRRRRGRSTSSCRSPTPSRC